MLSKVLKFKCHTCMWAQSNCDIFIWGGNSWVGWRNNKQAINILALTLLMILALSIIIQDIPIFVSPARFSGSDIKGSLSVVGVTKKFCHIFLGNHKGQLPDIWHRALVWRTVSCNAFLNLRHVHFLFDATLNI